MKARYFSFFFSLFIGLFLVAYAQKASAKDIILNLAFVDQIAINQGDIDNISSDLINKYPNSQVITLTAPARRLGNITSRGKAKTRKRLTDKIGELASTLNPNDKISMILISTHGSSGLEKNETSLSQIGIINEVDGPDEDFKSFFNPIKPFIADDAKVVLGACSTLCGTDKSSMSRAAQFLNFLGAHNGAIFGATTSIVNDTLSPIPTRKFAMVYIFGGLGIMEAHLVYSFATGHNIFMGLHTPEEAALKMLTNWAIATAVLWLPHVSIRPAMNDFFSRLNRQNVGKLLKLTNGNVESVEIVSYHFNREEVFSKTVSCAGLFVK
jgi:hypothetical protein